MYCSFGLKAGEKNTRFRVNNNLPGNRDFCPLVRRTAYLEEMVSKDLREKIHATLAKYDKDLLRRAAGYLYLKETQSSFEVEREKPSLDRAQRFCGFITPVRYANSIDRRSSGGITTGCDGSPLS